MSQREFSARNPEARAGRESDGSGRKAITAETAIQLERALGGSARFCINLQGNLRVGKGARGSFDLRAKYGPPRRNYVPAHPVARVATEAENERGVKEVGVSQDSSQEFPLECAPPKPRPGDTLAVLFIRAWFNDQLESCRLYLSELSQRERDEMFVNETLFNSVKKKYQSSEQKLKNVATSRGGSHKLPNQLGFRAFEKWMNMSRQAHSKYGSLKQFLASVETVEQAHLIFKQWQGVTKKVRALNAADAARLLADAGYLKPETNPVLARGSLRGAAIKLDEVDPSLDRDDVEELYLDTEKYAELETRAGDYIRQRFPGKSMADGESWFCIQVHKIDHPEQRGRRSGGR